jgi:hypothetical protein
MLIVTMRQRWVFQSAAELVLLLILLNSRYSCDAFVHAFPPLLARPKTTFWLENYGVKVLDSRVTYVLFTCRQPQDRAEDDESLVISSRRALLGSSVTSAFVALPLVSLPLWVVPSVVLADDATETKMVVTSDLISATAALRSVQLAQRRLASKTVREYILTRDYPAVQALLRAAPVSDIRKACRKLVTQLSTASGQGAAATTDSAKPLLTTEAEAQLAATVAVLEGEYTAFIRALERLDTTAMNGIRGSRTVSDTEWQSIYATTVETLAAFVTTAEQALL